MPNQFGLDRFDFEDAFGAQKENLCSKDLKQFIEENNLNLEKINLFPRGWHLEAIQIQIMSTIRLELGSWENISTLKHLNGKEKMLIIPH